MITFLASIPSPSSNTFDIGPLEIHVYGIFMGIAVATAYVVTVRRFTRLGGEEGVAERAAFWAVVIGFLGARLAYVSTHFSRYDGDLLGVFRLWEGGIAMFGGLTGGILAAYYVVRKAKGSFPMFADSVALGLPVAQAIGRWGNYFNQELFGTPSTLPWAIEIEPARRPEEYFEFETFHPTFLYEMLWSLGTIAVLLWAERRFRLKQGSLLLMYFISYGTIRFLLEFVRTDTSFRLLGMSRNGWVALLVVIASSVILWMRETGRLGSKASLEDEVAEEAEANE